MFLQEFAIYFSSDHFLFNFTLIYIDIIHKMRYNMVVTEEFIHKCIEIHRNLAKGANI